MFSCGYDSMHSVSAWSQNSNDNCDSEVGALFPRSRSKLGTFRLTGNPIFLGWRTTLLL